MKIAIYKDIKHEYETILEYKSDDIWPETSQEYARLSEIVEVEFPLLPQTDVVAKEVSLIDKAVDELFEKIQALRDKKQELLSLTFEEKQND